MGVVGLKKGVTLRGMSTRARGGGWWGGGGGGWVARPTLHIPQYYPDTRSVWNVRRCVLSGCFAAECPAAHASSPRYSASGRPCAILVILNFARRTPSHAFARHAPCTLRASRQVIDVACPMLSIGIFHVCWRNLARCVFPCAALRGQWQMLSKPRALHVS